MSTSSTAKIEVEVKFKPSDHIEQRLAGLGRFIGRKTFADEYFDNPDDYRLTTRDIWLRKRQDSFECKVPMAGTGNLLDTYTELVRPSEIADFLAQHRHAPTPASALESNDELARFLDDSRLLRFARLETRRDSYLVGPFRIDIDKADFGYRIGEVELMVDRESEVSDATARILEFCREHGLDTSSVPGKVLEYIRLNNAAQWRALLAAGLVDKKVLRR